MDLNIHPLQEEFDLLYKEMNDIYHEIALFMGLSDAAHTVLYMVCTLGEGCLQKDICARSFLPKQTVHSAVRKLEKEGLLSLSAGKGRDVRLYLTEAGVETARRCVLPVCEAELRVLDSMTPMEQAQLIFLTSKYVEQLRRQTRSIRP